MNKLTTIIAATAIGGATLLGATAYKNPERTCRLENTVKESKWQHRQRMNDERTYRFEDHQSRAHEQQNIQQRPAIPQRHDPPQGYIETQRGDYIVGRVVTPNETIIYQYKAKGAESEKMKAHLKEIQELKSKYKLQEFEKDAYRTQHTMTEKQREEFKQNMQDARKKMQYLDSTLEKELGRLEDIQEMNAQHLEQRMEEYARRTEERAERWGAYIDSLADAGKEMAAVKEAMRGLPDMIRWGKEMERWGQEMENTWAKEYQSFMKENMRKETYPNGEYYISLPKFQKEMPLPPEVPIPPRPPRR